MKKISMILAALAAAFAVSCTKEAPETQIPQDQNAPADMKLVTITASIEGADTKTSYTNNGDGTGSFSWTKGDQISVRCIDKSSNRKYFTFTANETGPSVIFSGSIPDDYTLETEAFFPASEDHDWVSWQPYYNIPMYKSMYVDDDLKGRLSADIPMFAKVTDGVYHFTHMCGAALLTFTNFPDFITKAKVSIVNSTLKISGTFKVSYSGANSEYMTWNSASAANDSEKTYIREVPVENNQTQLYLPYHGELWAASTISIIGYDAAGVEYTLLNGKSMKGNSTRFERGGVQPYAPLALPDYVPEVDWNKADWTGENAVSPTAEGFTDVKVVADEYYLYARIEAPIAFAWDKLYYYMGRGEGSNALSWAWTTTAAQTYSNSGAASLDALTLKYNGVTIDTKVETEGDNAYWYMAFPRNAHDITKEDGEIYFTLMGYVGGGFAGVAPLRWGPAMTVTLP